LVTSYTFVTNGIHSAFAQARAAAGERNLLTSRAAPGPRTCGTGLRISAGPAI
jgi:hypothetical protein